MLYVSRKFGQTKFAGLFFKDDFSKYRLDSVGSASSGYVFGRRYDVKVCEQPPRLWLNDKWHYWKRLRFEKSMAVRRLLAKW